MRKRPTCLLCLCKLAVVQTWRNLLQSGLLGDSVRWSLQDTSQQDHGFNWFKRRSEWPGQKITVPSRHSLSFTYGNTWLLMHGRPRKRKQSWHFTKSRVDLVGQNRINHPLAHHLTSGSGKTYQLSRLLWAWLSELFWLLQLSLAVPQRNREIAWTEESWVETYFWLDTQS